MSGPVEKNYAVDISIAGLNLAHITRVKYLFQHGDFHALTVFPESFEWESKEIDNGILCGAHTLFGFGRVRIQNSEELGDKILFDLMVGKIGDCLARTPSVDGGFPEPDLRVILKTQRISSSFFLYSYEGIRDQIEKLDRLERPQQMPPEAEPLSKEAYSTPAKDVNEAVQIIEQALGREPDLPLEKEEVDALGVFQNAAMGSPFLREKLQLFTASLIDRIIATARKDILLQRRKGPHE